ncbi:hypothetical protein Tco_0452351 [Tanacetum coccineum]
MYEDAILIPEIVANNFELRHGLINLVQNKQFFGHDKEDPHAHIRYFNKITSTMRVPNVPIATLKLNAFSILYRREQPEYGKKKTPSNHVRTLGHLVFKFINHFSSSKTTNLRMNNQISAKVENFMDKMPRRMFKIIESKSKVRQTRAKQLLQRQENQGFSASAPAPAPSKH